MTHQLSTSLHKQGSGVRMSESMDGSVYSSGKVSRMHETSTDHLRKAWEVASQFLGSDLVGLGKPKTIKLREPETSHFILVHKTLVFIIAKTQDPLTKCHPFYAFLEM